MNPKIAKLLDGTCSSKDAAEAAQEIANLLTAKPLVWTKERPTVPGAFWCRDSESGLQPGIVFVSRSPHGRRQLRVNLYGRHMDVSEFSGEWSSGPIPEPIEVTP